MAWPEDEIVEIKIGYLVNDQQCYNVLHYVADGTFPGFDPFDLSSALLNTFDNQLATAGTLLNDMRLFMGPNVTINRLSVQGIYPTRYRAVVGAYTSAGLATADCNAQNVTAVIQKFGLGGERKDIGSFHLGGLSEEVYTAGELDEGPFGNLQSLAENLEAPLVVDEVEDQTYTPVILNKEKIVVDGKDRYIISGFTEIFGTDAKRTIRTQRSRTKGYGI